MTSSRHQIHSDVLALVNGSQRAVQPGPAVHHSTSSLGAAGDRPGSPEGSGLLGEPPPAPASAGRAHPPPPSSPGGSLRPMSGFDEDSHGFGEYDEDGDLDGPSHTEPPYFEFGALTSQFPTTDPPLQEYSATRDTGFGVPPLAGSSVSSRVPLHVELQEAARRTLRLSRGYSVYSDPEGDDGDYRPGKQQQQPQQLQQQRQQQQRGPTFSQDQRFRRGRTAMDVVSADLVYSIEESPSCSLSRDVSESLHGTAMQGDASRRFPRPFTATPENVGPGSYYQARTPRFGGRNGGYGVRPSSSFASKCPRKSPFEPRKQHESSRPITTTRALRQRRQQQQQQTQTGPLGNSKSAPQLASPVMPGRQPFSPDSPLVGSPSVGAHISSYDAKRRSKQRALPSGPSRLYLNGAGGGHNGSGTSGSRRGGEAGIQFGRGARVTLPEVEKSAQLEEERAAREAAILAQVEQMHAELGLPPPAPIFQLAPRRRQLKKERAARRQRSSDGRASSRAASRAGSSRGLGHNLHANPFLDGGLLGPATATSPEGADVTPLRALEDSHSRRGSFLGANMLGVAGTTMSYPSRHSSQASRNKGRGRSSHRRRRGGGGSRGRGPNDNGCSDDDQDEEDSEPEDFGAAELGAWQGAAGDGNLRDSDSIGPRAPASTAAAAVAGTAGTGAATSPPAGRGGRRSPRPVIALSKSVPGALLQPVAASLSRQQRRQSAGAAPRGGLLWGGATNTNAQQPALSASAATGDGVSPLVSVTQPRSRTADPRVDILKRDSMARFLYHKLADELGVDKDGRVSPPPPAGAREGVGGAAAASDDTQRVAAAELPPPPLYLQRSRLAHGQRAVAIGDAPVDALLRAEAQAAQKQREARLSLARLPV